MKYILASNLEKIEDRFNVHIDQNTAKILKSYAISQGDTSYVITCEEPHSIQVFKFGMTPFYSTECLNIITARAEGYKNLKDDPNYCGSKSIFLKTEFKKPIQSQRCIVIADAYYEWSKENKPYLVYLQNKNRPFAFAGIYDYWLNPLTKETVTAFAIITTVANGLLQSIGVKRMPVILSRSRETAWIKSSNHLSDVLNLLVPYQAERMNAYPVGEMVSIPGMNNPELLNPIGDKLIYESNPVSVSNGYRHKEKPKSDRNWVEGNSNAQSQLPV